LTDRIRKVYEYIIDVLDGLEEIGEEEEEKLWDIKSGEKLTVIFNVRLIGYRQPVYVDVEVTYGNYKLDKETVIERREASYQIAHDLVSYLRYYITSVPIERMGYSEPLYASGYLAESVNRQGNRVRIAAYYTMFLMKLPIPPYKEGRHPPFEKIYDWMRAKGVRGNPYAISMAIAKRGFQTERLCLDKVMRKYYINEQYLEIMHILASFGLFSGYNVGLNVYDVSKSKKFAILLRYSGGRVWC